MAQTVNILVRADDRAALTAILDDRNRPQKHVQRARIVLLSADRLSVVEGARQTDMSRPAVWRWQQRFAEEGVDGLLRDKTRKRGRTPLAPATIAKVLALPCGEPPKAATCLIPWFDGAVLSHEWKDALWARFCTGAPKRRRRSVERYSIVKRA